MNITSRLWSTSPFLFALVVLAYWGWSVINAYNYPYDGIGEIDSANKISSINPQSLNANLLLEGDQIINIEGKDWSTDLPHYASLRAGQTAELQILRAGKPQTVAILLEEPTPEERVERLAPMMVAVVFWLIGIGIQTFMPASAATNIYFLFFQFSSLLLITGPNTWIGPEWSRDLYTFLVWFMGPLIVHFHFYFPQKNRFARSNWFLLTLYILAGLGWVPYFVIKYPILINSNWYGFYSNAEQIFVAANFLFVILLLIDAYNYAISPGVRSKIRIVVLGGALSLLPLVSLYILPKAFWGQYLVPYAFFFVFLSILPVTYGYAIFRHRLIEIERHVNRGATYILVYTVLGSIYLLIYSLLNRGFQDRLVGEPLLNTLLVIILATAFVPLHRFIQRLVDNAFYGSSYDYRSAVMEITQGFEQIDDLRALAQVVGQRLVNTLRVQDVCVFLRSYTGEITVLEVSPGSILKPERSETMMPLPRSSLDFLLKVGQNERTALRDALGGIELTPEEHQLLNTEQVHLWVPIIGHGQVQGLIALGPKYGGDIFSSEDLDILRVVGRQVGPIVENIHLVESLEQTVKDRTTQLYDEKERAEAILASVGDGVFVTDLNFCIQKVNTAYLVQTGYKTEELLGQNFSQLLVENSPPGVLAVMGDTLSNGQVWSGEMIARRKLGREYDIHLTMAPVLDQAGDIVSYVGSQRDITSQKELERMKDQFVSDVSHELRTPTTNIGLYLELLENAPSEKVGDYLAVVRDQGLQLRKLVEDILDLSRLSMGRVKQTEFVSLDVNALVAQVVSAHAAMADVAGLRLGFTPDTGIPRILGEESQIKRVLTNLVANAVRYTPTGSVEVRTFADSDCVAVEVKDTGMGIDPEDLPHLFERFYRGRRVRQTRIYGTGLGLAIVKEIIELHHGVIEVDSIVDQGTIFRIKIPV